RRLSGPVDTPGAMTFFHAQPNEHLSFAKHLTAERQVEEFIALRGTVVRWEKVRQNNHWLDALYNAAAAGHFCGARLIKAERKRAPAVRPKPRSLFALPDGRPWLVTER
ncbi:MAG: hypothetical protein JXA57_09640, partial [Armatimonadetes bacterium]|nr:hypothetical protein [Armatimonadota bacterium]